MVSLKHFPAPAAKVSLPWAEKCSEKLWERQRMLPTEAGLLCTFVNLRLGFGIKGPIYKDQHSLCQILTPDLSWRRSRRQILGVKSLFAAVSPEESSSPGRWSTVLVSCWKPRADVKGRVTLTPPHTTLGCCSSPN